MDAYDNSPNEHDPAFVPFVVDKALRFSIKFKATQIRFKKCHYPFTPPSDQAAELALVSGREYRSFVIKYENEDASLTDGARDYGTSMEVARISVHHWVQFISRIKVLAKIADYGPCPMTNGSIQMDIENGMSAYFILEKNPNPFQDTEVVLKVSDVGGA